MENTNIKMKRNPIAAPGPEAKGVEVTIANDANIETMNRTHKSNALPRSPKQDRPKNRTLNFVPLKFSLNSTPTRIYSNQNPLLAKLEYQQ